MQRFRLILLAFIVLFFTSCATKNTTIKHATGTISHIESRFVSSYGKIMKIYVLKDSQAWGISFPENKSNQEINLEVGDFVEIDNDKSTLIATKPNGEKYLYISDKNDNLLKIERLK
ncbi:hypothetical protein N5915_01965 [Arcobacter lacus]|uniref:hypothetical protein n=1 Tax=Arcobacter lacus TaxID=1912876 RepID=UPI0021BB9977|nr:hypothetical protein [Arcobacter lacus]MCT7908314.1 hypothetical protein [Arcobacter lacus]